MNKAVTKRIISKQEANVLLADLDLTICTETIENVSISDSRVLKASSTAPSNNNKSFIALYKIRPTAYNDWSLHQYFYRMKNADRVDNPGQKLIIPNFVGVNGTPKFPVTDDYARHTLIVHRPWREYPKSESWRSEFESFINSDDAPLSAKMAYVRVMRRFVDKMQYYDAKAADGDHSGNDVSEEDQTLMALVGLKGNDDDYNEDDMLFQQLERGKDYSWDKPPIVSIKAGLAATNLHRKTG